MPEISIERSITKTQIQKILKMVNGVRERKRERVNGYRERKNISKTGGGGARNKRDEVR